MTDGAFETRGDVRPSTHVERFFLAPDEVRCVGVLADDRADQLAVERIELLDADDGGVFDGVLLTARDEIVVDLATAEDNTLDIGRIGKGFGVGQDFLEAGSFEEIGFRRDRFGATQQALGVIRISGLRKSRCFWRRSAWKYWAGVVKLPTIMFFSAQSWR